MTTARQIVVRSLRLIGVLGSGEPGDSQEVVDGLDALNTMIDSWSEDQRYILAGVNEAFPLTGGQASYTVGPAGNFATTKPVTVTNDSFVRVGNVDYPVPSMTQQDYNAIPVKSVAGIPNALWYSQGPTLGTVTLFPVPTGGVLYLASFKALTAFADLDTDYALGTGYQRMLTYNLAVEVAPEYEKEAAPTVQRIAIGSKRLVKRTNLSVPQLDFHLPQGYRGTWIGG